MTQVYRIKVLKEITESAIRRYSEETWCAGWFSGIEYDIYNAITNTDDKILSCFLNHEITAMKALIKENLWVKYTDDGVVLSREVFKKSNDNK